MAAATETTEGTGDLWVTLMRCHDLGEADAVVARLESAGIKTFLPDEMVMQSNAWNLNTFGYVRVQVGPSDLAEAEKVIGPDGLLAEDSEFPPFANLPLSDGMKVVAVLIPVFSCGSLFPFLVARGGYLRQGFDRRATEWTIWYVAAFLGWLIFFIWLIMRNRKG